MVLRSLLNVIIMIVGNLKGVLGIENPYKIRGF